MSISTMRFATLFAGGGGADIGLMAAGLSPAWAVEYDPAIADVYRRDLGDHVIVADVRAVDYAALPRVDWLHASPACTNASVANIGAAEDAADIEAAQAVARVIHAQRPRVFTLENVWMYRNFAAFRLILDALGDGGYMYDFEHVNAADHGVPQTRRRLILRAVHGALLPPLPPPLPWVGWYQAIEDLLPDCPVCQLAPWQIKRLPADLRDSVLLAQGGYGGRIAMAAAYEPAGTITANGNQGGLRALLFSNDSHTASGADSYRVGDAPAQSMTTQRLGRARALILGNIRQVNPDGNSTWRVGDDPAMTIPATVTRRDASTPLIVDRVEFTVRRITPRCLARFQTFPDWYELPAKRTLAGAIIGNAVPPLLMERIARDLVGVAA